MKLDIKYLAEIPMNSNSSHKHVFLYHLCNLQITNMHMARVKHVFPFFDASNFFCTGGGNIPTKCACFANNGDVTMCYVSDLSVNLPDGVVLTQ